MGSTPDAIAEHTLIYQANLLAHKTNQQVSAVKTDVKQMKLSIFSNLYQYSGQYRDAESYLDYLSARYYDPDLMRFTGLDIYDLLNLYAYGDGNPIMNEDPSGHMPTFATDFEIINTIIDYAVRTPNNPTLNEMEKFIVGATPFKKAVNETLAPILQGMEEQNIEADQQLTILSKKRTATEASLIPLTDAKKIAVDVEKDKEKIPVAPECNDILDENLEETAKIFYLNDPSVQELINKRRLRPAIIINTQGFRAFINRPYNLSWEGDFIHYNTGRIDNMYGFTSKRTHVLTTMKWDLRGFNFDRVNITGDSYDENGYDIDWVDRDGEYYPMQIAHPLQYTGIHKSVIQHIIIPYLTGFSVPLP